jgi:hypothetical protein
MRTIQNQENKITKQLTHKLEKVELNGDFKKGT